MAEIPGPPTREDEHAGAGRDLLQQLFGGFVGGKVVRAVTQNGRVLVHYELAGRAFQAEFCPTAYREVDPSELNVIAFPNQRAGS